MCNVLHNIFYVYRKIIFDIHKKRTYSNSMNIQINLDVELAKKKMSLTELSQRIGISMTNLSLLKNGKVKAIRFSTLEAICQTLNCQPGDILVYEEV